MNYKKEFDWEPIKEEKGWKNKNMRDYLHKVVVEEHETGEKNRQKFNFTREQTSDDRWKKHVDQWVERLDDDRDPSVM